MFYDEIVQEMKEQLEPSYNSLSLQSDSLCLLIEPLSLLNFLRSIYKTNYKDQLNNIITYNMMIFYYYAASFFILFMF